MQAVSVPYGPWAPSTPDFGAGDLVVANNVIPVPGGYGPFPGLSDTGDDVSQVPLGAASFWDDENHLVIVGGAGERMFVRRRDGVVDTPTLDGVNANERWDFAGFNNYVFATIGGALPHYLPNINSSTFFERVPAANIPSAAHCARVGKFLVLGRLKDNPSAIQWGPFNNPLGAWGTDRQTQAAIAFLPDDNGPVRKIVGGRYPLVFQERAVLALRYEGPPKVFGTYEIDDGVGCLSSSSVILVGHTTYYLSQNGFKRTNGSEVQNIGDNRVNRWFFDTCRADMLRFVNAAVDWENNGVLWQFHSAAASGIEPDRFLFYSWTEDRWTSGTLTAAQIVGVQLDFQSLEEVGALYPDVDVDVPAPFDSSVWQGRDRGLAAFVADDATNTIASLYMLSGPALQADFQTAEMAPIPGRRAFVSGARALIEDTTQASTFAVVQRGNADTATTTAYAAIGADGFAPLRADGRQVALAQRIPAAAVWDKAQGAEVRVRPSGGR